MSTSSLELLRSRILASLGLTLAACGVADPVDDEAGVTTDPSGSSSSGSSSSGSSSSGSSSSSEGSSSEGSGTEEEPNPTAESPDEGFKFDMLEPDLAPLGDCTVMVGDGSLLGDHPDCPMTPDEGCGSGVYLGCVELPPDQTCAELCPRGDCIADWTNCQGDPFYDTPTEVCGPYLLEGMCCSIVQTTWPCSDGRPLVIAEHSRRASLVRGVEAAEIDLARFADLPLALRRRLGQRWVEVAQAEHASIASFARFTIQLLAIAAPPELIRDALAAAADEVRHAEAALALASAFEGQALDWGPLDLAGALAEPLDLAALVHACVDEGCIGETLAALELRVAAGECEDRRLAELLVAIAEDELRHAELAWRFVKWALDRQPDLRAGVAERFAALTIEAAEPESLDAHERERLRSLGYLATDERRRVELAGIRALLRPCANALLAA